MICEDEKTKFKDRLADILDAVQFVSLVMERNF